MVPGLRLGNLLKRTQGHRNGGGECRSQVSVKYAGSHPSKHKTALVYVLERKVPSIAPYLALQEYRNVMPAEITYARQMETKGLS